MPDFEEGIPTEVRITLSARSGNSQTRGDGDPKDPTSTVELIHDWWIAFIDRKGEVTVITRNGIPAQDRTTSTSVSVEGGGFEAETFRTIIPSGKYRIYAFANIPAKTADEIKAMLVEEKTPGVKDKISKHLKDFVTTAFINNNMQWPSDVNIPMSSIKEKTIKNTIEEAFNIEVIRAVAKMQFAFTNPSTDKIELNELKFGPITDSDEISIVPNNDAIGQKANDKLLNKSTNTLSFPSMGQTLEPEKGTYSFEFYCKESLGGWFDKDGKILKKEDANKNQIEHEDVFKIDLTVTKTKAGDNTGTEVTRTFYTKDITYINRNDWIYI
ncbi:MAG: hypothetical protein K2K93_06845, partial [Muribaculaceae bacterium]|nr:hypothetical protein [Muribaculaceae bacterium]